MWYPTETIAGPLWERWRFAEKSQKKMLACWPFDIEKNRSIEVNNVRDFAQFSADEFKSLQSIP